MRYYTTRAFPTASRQYEAGDAIDPVNITAAEWIRGTESGAVVPARWYGTAAELAARGVPGPGVQVYETDTRIARVGDGATAVASLPQVGNNTYVPAKVVTGVGIDPTGATDSSVAIQALHDSLSPTGGGWLFFPPGRYKASLTIDRPVKISGITSATYNDVLSSNEGNNDVLGGSRIICTTDGANALVFNPGSEGSVLEDITVEYAGAALPTSGVGVLMNSCSHTRMHRVQVLGFYDNVFWVSGMWPSMQNCRIINPVRHGLHITNTVTSDEGAAHIEGNLFYKGRYVLSGNQVVSPNGGSAVYWESGGGLRYLGNYVNGLPGGVAQWDYGFHIAAADTTNTGVLNITGNCFEVFSQAGIRITNQGPNHTGRLAKILITANEISTFTSGVNCIVINPTLQASPPSTQPVFNVTVNGNYLTTSGAAAGLRMGNVEKIVVGKNMIQANGYGVIVDSGSRDWYVDPQNYSGTSCGLLITSADAQAMGVAEDTRYLSVNASTTSPVFDYNCTNNSAGEIEFSVSGTVAGVGSAYRRKRWTFTFATSGQPTLTQVEDVQVGASTAVDLSITTNGIQMTLNVVNGVGGTLTGAYAMRIHGQIYGIARR
jgi:hypothetical protein